MRAAPLARRHTCSSIVLFPRGARAFPGNRVDWYRAGITAITNGKFTPSSVARQNPTAATGNVSKRPHVLQGATEIAEESRSR